LLSRFILFSYEYEISKINRIFKFIEKEEHQNSMPKQKIKRKMVDVKGNSDLFSQIERLSGKIGEETGGYGLRAQRSLQILAKANALLNDRKEVTQEDIDKILHLANWVNCRFNPL
jgi:hypothetical protein